jgi:hypothetical protein
MENENTKLNENAPKGLDTLTCSAVDMTTPLNVEMIKELNESLKQINESRKCRNFGQPDTGLDRQRDMTEFAALRSIESMSQPMMTYSS